MDNDPARSHDVQRDADNDEMDVHMELLHDYDIESTSWNHLNRAGSDFHRRATQMCKPAQTEIQ